MLAGGVLCAGVVTCAAGAGMAVFGGAELYEGADWFASKDETQHGRNPLRSALETFADKVGLPTAIGTSAYYVGATVTNFSSVVVKVDSGFNSAAGWVTITEQRLETLNNFQRTTSAAALVGNSSKIVNPPNR